jgi:CxxC motif-containing protein (DUF1111 family)
MSRPNRIVRWTLSLLASGLAVVTLIALAGRYNAPANALPAVGPPLPNLSSFELDLYNRGIFPFDLSWSPNFGLGPVFTQTGCRGCHSTPVAGGFSTTKSTSFGKLNSDGSFNPLINEGGPLLQSKSVAPLISNGACVLAGEVVPADATIVSKRVVPALFGSGLIDAIPDATILGNAANQANDPLAQSLGIHGVANMTPDFNGVLRPGRFGRKAQRPTLLQQVADAFQQDVGITNPLNPNEDLPQGQPVPPNCQVLRIQPNDAQGNEVVDIFQVLEFMAPVAPQPPTEQSLAGQTVFSSIGCALCHTPSLQTGSGVIVPLTLTTSGTVATSETSAALSNQTANLYSDLLLHDMGPGLADGMVQGQATGSQWRTTPLWGLGQRTVFLHDGRTNNLDTAIRAHGGEAAGVVSNYVGLSADEKANLLAFLKSL